MITPPTTPAAAVATPVITAAFGDPFQRAAELALALRAALPEERDDEADERRLDELGDRRPDALEPPRLFRLAPFELRDADFCLLVEERVLAWAMAPP